MNLRSSLFAVILALGATASFAQSPYHFNWKKESAIGAVGLSAWGGSYLLDNKPVYNANQLLYMSPVQVNYFDRSATDNYSQPAQKTSDILSMGAKVLPLALMIDKNQRNDFGTIAALYAETYLVANGLTVLSKNVFQRTRPYVYNDEVALDKKQSASAYHSFVSGHTSKTAAMTFFAAKVYSDYHPDSEWRPVIWTAAAAIPAITGYMRVKAGKHFPTDVMAGYAVGALTGILVPQLHKIRPGKNDNLKVMLGMNGANLSLTF